MNIFVTNKCPIKSAQYLDTKRVNKMILESAQILSTSMRECGYIGDDIYKSTHKNHPSCIWARSSRANYKWLLTHYRALAKEYYTRRGKWHKSYSQLNMRLSEGTKLIPKGKLTPFVNCAARQDMNISYKHINDVHIAYKLYLDKRWENDKIKPVWS